MARRRNLLALCIKPAHLFAVGAVVIVAYLLQANLVVRIGQVLVFAVLAMAAGKRIRWPYFLIMVSSITFFNLLTPLGELLFQVGPLRVTRGALDQGLMKGFAIVGLVFISLFAVSSNLRLPGTFGGLLGRLFYYFERILEGRKRVSARHLLASVDDVLLRMYPIEDSQPSLSDGPESPAELVTEPLAQQPTPGSGPPERTTAAGAALMLVVVAASWATAVLSMLGKT